MTPADGWMFALAVLLVPLAAVLQAARLAFVRMTPHRAAKLADEGRRGAEGVVALMRAPARARNALALLVVAAEVAVVALVTAVAMRQAVTGWAVAAGIVVGVVVLFIVVETAAKTFALHRSDGITCAMAAPVGAVTRIVAPLAQALVRVSDTLAADKASDQPPSVTEEELREMVDLAESGDIVESSERDMIHSILELDDTVVREIMVPRPDMVMVSADEPLPSVLETILRAGHSRLPVYRGDRDRIVGLIYAKDLLRRLHATGDEEGAWEDLVRPATFVPELKPVDALLRELQAEKVHLAVVVDEYGATTGLVTVEDILEEIVGEIVDEYDREEILVENVDEQVWRVDARLAIDELNDLLATDLPDDEWDTVGGLLFGVLGHVADSGEQVEVDSLRLTAEKVVGRRIAKVLVERVESEEAVAEAESGS